MADFAGFAPVPLEPLADRKKLWAQESADAWAHYGEELRARDENTSRLKVLRLAKEAAETIAAAQAALVPKARAKLKHSFARGRPLEAENDRRSQQGVEAGRR